MPEKAKRKSRSKAVKVVDPYALPAVIQQAAEDHNMDCEAMRNTLLTAPYTLHLSDKDGKASFVPGACISGNQPLGRYGVDVMIITGMVTTSDLKCKKVRPTKKTLELLTQLGAKDIDNWYMTAAVKFKPEIKVKKPKKAWINISRPLLLTEIDVLKPKYLLLLGADAVQAVMGPGSGLSKIRGEVVEYNGMHVMATMNPSVLFYASEQEPGLVRDLTTFIDYINSGGTARKYVGNYTKVENLQQCCNMVDTILSGWHNAPELPPRLAIDAEWGGLERSDYLHGQLRSIQISDRIGRAWTIVLRREGLIYNPDNCCSEPEVVEQLQRLLAYPGVAVGGHNFREDMHWLLRIGLDCRIAYMNGIDTMLAYHTAYPEEDGHGLEQLALRYTGLGRYDIAVQQWRDANGFGDKSDLLEKHGYAYIPDDLLFDLYAPADVDVVMHAWPEIAKALKSMKVAKPYVLNGAGVNTLFDMYYSIIHPCNIPLFEMEEVGIAPDKDRLKAMTELTSKYMDKLETAFKEKINWPTFNVRSVENVREFLFGSTFTGKANTRPSDAVVLDLTPVATTEKPSRKWSEVPDDDKNNFRVFPATGGETLKILGADNELVQDLQQLKFIDQLRKNFLCPPTELADGSYVWDSGLMGAIGCDGRIHTTISQMTETGRYRSYKPNLQNL